MPPPPSLLYKLNPYPNPKVFSLVLDTVENGENPCKFFSSIPLRRFLFISCSRNTARSERKSLQSERNCLLRQLSLEQVSPVEDNSPIPVLVKTEK